MSSIMQKDRDFLLSFIRYYKGLPSLWNPKCPEYRDKVIKMKSFMLLLNHFREMYPTATLADVKRKINSLRSNFRRYHHRAKNGQAAKVFWFNEMNFIVSDEPEYTEIDVEASYLELETNPLYEVNMTETFDTSNDAENSSENPEYFTVQDDKNQIEFNTWQDTLKVGHSSPKYKESQSKHTLSKDDDEEEKQSPRASSGDEFDLWGKVVAMELRKMEPTQQIFAKKAISDILMEGQLGLLDKDSVQINKATDQCNYDINKVTSKNNLENNRLKKI